MTIRVLNTRIVGDMAFSLINTRIYDILVAELANQVALAIADGADPTPYEIDVTEEKADPWNTDQFPVVNVSYDAGDIDRQSSPNNSDQIGWHVYNLDVYHSVDSVAVATAITEYGDKATAKAVQQAAGIINRIIMADINVQLQYPRGQVVAERQIRQLTPFQQVFGDNPVENVVAIRLPLHVRHVEEMPQIEGVTIDGWDFTVRRSDTTIDTDIDIQLEQP